MSWHYRIRRRIIDGEPWFDIVEYYKPKGWTENSIAPGSETKKGLIEELERMLGDAKTHSVLIDKIP